jgi:hypothetical protein
MRILSLSLLLLFSFSLGCKSKKTVAQAQAEATLEETDPIPGEPIELQMLDSGAYCGIDEAGQQLITSQAEWEKLWKAFSANRMPAPPPMKVDFSEHAVVACFMGTQTSGGHEVTLEKARVEGSRLYLDIYHLHPGRYCITTSAITQPYALALVPAYGLAELEANVIPSTEDCDK